MKPFKELTLSFQSRPEHISDFKIKENTGLDTETYKGYVRLITDDSGAYKQVDNLLEILQFLTHKRFKGKFNWFYNIRYDFESIVKYLPHDLLYELYTEGKVNYERYRITYFAGKLFSISVDSNAYTFYDLFNFLEISLDNAAKIYLQSEKLSTIDANQLNTNWKYWEDNLPLIIEYCIKDSYLTKQLADYFWSLIYKTINFYPKRPISKGKLSEEYFLNTCYIPIVKDIPLPVLETAYRSYSGGRFELLKRGYFPNVYVYDIKSAYPYEMTKLLDYSNGTWTKTNKFNPDADYGVYHCRIHTLEPYFSPFTIKRAGLCIYPIGSFYQYLNYDEILFIRKYYPTTKILIIKGFEFTTNLEYYPYKDEIERLYKWKNTEKDETIKYCVKIILNSLYGKTIQTVGGRTGKLFNPLHADKTTSNTRLKLQELALQSPENIIQFSTDSVSSKIPLITPKNPQLGDFDFEFHGEGIFAITDVYSLWNNHKIKDRFRGYVKNKDTVFNLFEILDLEPNNKTLVDILKQMQVSNSTKYTYTKKRPYHLGECLLHTKQRTQKDINVFFSEKKTIDLNSDVKRFWTRPIKSAKDLMHNQINSYPLKFGD